MGRNNLDIRLVVERVGGEGDIDGAHRRRLCLIERAAHDARHLLRMRNLRAPLAELSDHFNKVSAPFRELADVLVRGCQHERRAALGGVGEQAYAVGKPRFDVQVHERGRVAIARVSVRHAHRRALLRGEHVANIRVVLQLIENRPLAGARIAEYVLDALGAQHLHQRALSCHYWHIITLNLIRHFRFRGNLSYPSCSSISAPVLP